MEHAYGKCHSWLEAMKVFEVRLMMMPGDRPAKLWPVAKGVIGDEHPKWTKDLIKQFEHYGAVEKADRGESFQETTYYVRHDVLDYGHP